MWKGFVSFGLVTIPVRLYSAVETSEDIRLNLLHREDKGRIRYKRTCERCGKDVDWPDIVKGYEFAEDEYVEVTEEDLDKADVAASSSIDILDFVEAKEIDPKFFDQPYWLEPQKGAEKPYALLREALARSGRVGIAKLVLRTREHLACLRPDGLAIQVEGMRWADEVRPADGLKLPEGADIRDRELQLASTLIDQMTGPFDPVKYHDDYREKLRAIIDEKVQGAEPAPHGEAPTPTKVVDLMKVLQQSLAAKGKAPPEEQPEAANGHGAKGSKRRKAS